MMEGGAYDVYFYEAFAEEADGLRRFLPSDVKAGFTWKTIQEAGDTRPPAPLISVRTQSRLPHAWAPALKAILSRSTGFDHLERYRRATGAEIGYGYLPLYCHRAVAEQALLLWLALLRRLPQQREAFARFSRDGLTGGECAGKHLVVVGVGNIGSEVARIGLGLDMRVTGVDIEPKHDFVSHAPLERAVATADVLVCCMNLTPENTGYFTTARLSHAPAGLVFVNVARGEMAPATVLLPMLEDGHLGGVGMDVYPQESELALWLRSGTSSADAEVRATLAMAKRRDVIFTPHNAFNTREAVERKARQSIEQIVAFRQEGRFVWEAPR